MSENPIFLYADAFICSSDCVSSEDKRIIFKFANNQSSGFITPKEAYDLLIKVQGLTSSSQYDGCFHPDLCQISKLQEFLASQLATNFVS